VAPLCGLSGRHARKACSSGATLAAQATYHIFLDVANLNVQDTSMGNKAVSEAASLMGKRSYRARLERLGIERLQEIARENGKKGGRPPKAKGDKR
jgi:hypothetical protein